MINPKIPTGSVSKSINLWLFPSGYKVFAPLDVWHRVHEQKESKGIFLFSVGVSIGVWERSHKEWRQITGGMIVSMSVLCKGYNSLIPTFKGFIIVASVAVASHLKFSSQCISTVDWQVWLFGMKERQDKKNSDIKKIWNVGVNCYLPLHTIKWRLSITSWCNLTLRGSPRIGNPSSLACFK